jgi:two-component system OmpR family response regulator
VSGLEQGADDFVNKPVQPRVLLRRTQPKAAPDSGELLFGALRIVGADHSVYWRDELCMLSNTEYKLLLVLAERPGACCRATNC